MVGLPALARGGSGPVAHQRPGRQHRIPEPLDTCRHNQPWVLSRLTIRNFAIIDRLEIDFSPGLNVITGETGAGKSILVDAVGALLGDRLGPEVVRSGADRALIEGVFVLSDAAAQRPELVNVMEQYGLEAEEGALMVSRD